jgi:hypothetical protein
MLARFLSELAVRLLDWLEGRIGKQDRAVDADVDRGRLRRAGSRIREWMQSNGAGERKQPDQGRPKD